LRWAGSIYSDRGNQALSGELAKMSIKKSIKDEVESVLVVLNEKIDSLKAKVDKLCESTEQCAPLYEKSSESKEKK